MSNIKLDAAKAAKYWGCEVICAPYTGQPNKKLTGKMIGVTTDSLYIKFPEWATSHGMYISDCQLILTPLPRITDEHAIEVADIINLHYPFSEPLRFDCGLVKMGYQLQPNKSSSLYNYDVIDLLRSLGYDCDNAISEGWAVDKTTLS